MKRQCRLQRTWLTPQIRLSYKTGVENDRPPGTRFKRVPVILEMYRYTNNIDVTGIFAPFSAGGDGPGMRWTKNQIHNIHHN